MKLKPLIAAMLYFALAAGANPVTAGPLAADQRSALLELREGGMRKLVIHPDALPARQVPFLNGDGAETDLDQSRGKFRLVNFWATWCAPCRAEKPTLDALNKTLSGPDFEVIAIATGRNSPEAIKRFNEQIGIESLATYRDPKSEAARAMGVLGLPVSILIDPQGREIARLPGGADWTTDSSLAVITGLMNAYR